MRPLRLMMRAFGPYPDRQVLDFRQFGDRTLFLIHGPTGSGKTSILDAISFALYGKPAGSERDPKRMRSDHADPVTPTEVEFDFRLHNLTYRVYRKPEYAVPKKRGEGTAATKAEAYLARLAGLGGEAVEKIIATGRKTVTAKIEELLGFRSDQFSQVVMLPQGEFQRLLMANSRERQSILEVLFQTEWYSRIEQALKTKSGELKSRIQTISERKNDILKQAEAESLDEMQGRHANNNERHQQLKRKLEELADDEKKAVKALENARQVIEKFERLTQARSALEKIQSQTENIESKKSELDLARKAQKIAPEAKRLHELIEERRKAEQGRESALKAHERAKNNQNRLAQQLRDLKSKEPEIENYKQELVILDGLTDHMGQLNKALGECANAEKSLAAASLLFQRSSKSLEESIALIEQMREEKDRAQRTAFNTESLELKLEKLESNHKNMKQLAKLKRELKEVEGRLRKAGIELSRLEQMANEKMSQLKAMEETWIRGQAAILAQKLVEGEPCPVCGSLEHPQPAHAVGYLPGEQELTAKKEELERIQLQIGEARDAKNEDEKKRSGCVSAIEVLQEKLLDVELFVEAEVNSERKVLAAQLKEAKEAAARVKNLEDQIDKTQAGLENLRDEREHAEKQKVEAQQKLAASRAIANAIGTNIPEHLRSAEALEHEKRRLSEKVTNIQRDLKKAEEDVHKAGQDVAAKGAGLRAAEDKYTEASQKVLNQTQIVERLVRQHGFRDQAHFEQSKKTDSEMDHLQAVIDSFEKDLKSAKDRLDRATEEVAGIERPDIEAIENEAENAKKWYQAALREEATLSSELRQEAMRISQFRNLQNQMEDLERQFGVVEAMSAAANGQNPLRITFQRFVLSTLLDDVLAAATQRFRIMSNGRFDLNRLDQMTDKRSPGGLDLEVYDAYTGTSRPVNTLSGGERFLASLSLALGLADVVQAYAGGIRLDAIFVDEGFGSLDPEALDLAFRALMDLQQSGRLVGVISHVPELKERIDARVEVASTRRGSTVRLIAP